MNWAITQASANFNANQGVVIFTDNGSADRGPRSINVSFPLSPLNQPRPTSISQQTLITLAKQVLTDAVNSAQAQGA
jgi:hypothetical protein